MNKATSSKLLQEQIAQDKAVLTFVGMSNTGKSFISSKLVNEMGFERICVDDLIEDELEPVLREYGYKGLEDLARWMGHPYETRSRQNQKAYLDIETKIMTEIINRIKNESRTNNLIIDTTGSVVHCGHRIRSGLSRASTVVYLSVSEEDLEEMFRSFLEKPKPIYWGDVFKLNHEYESHDQALAEYYPKLLNHRSELYLTMAHATLPRKQLIDIGAQEFLNKVYVGLPS